MTRDTQRKQLNGDNAARIVSAQNAAIEQRQRRLSSYFARAAKKRRDMPEWQQWTTPVPYRVDGDDETSLASPSEQLERGRALLATVRALAQCDNEALLVFLADEAFYTPPASPRNKDAVAASPARTGLSHVVAAAQVIRRESDANAPHDANAHDDANDTRRSR